MSFFSGTLRSPAATPAWKLPAAILALATVCAAVTAVSVPVQFPMPGYYADIRLWAAEGRIGDTFTPLAYPLFAAPAYRWAGSPGIVALQAILYILLVYVAIRLLVRLSLPVEWAALGSLVVLFNPEIVSSIAKVWDVDLSTFLLLAFVLLCARLQSTGPDLRTALTAGAVLGMGVFCRPNYALLLAPYLYAAHCPPGPDRRSKTGQTAAMVLVSVAVFALLGVASHGSPFLPRNGPYNLFAGNNSFSKRILLDRLNAETSIPPAFAAHYPPPLPDVYSPAVLYSAAYEPFYTHQALLYMRQHPGEELELIGIKLLTLFRPDTKVHALRSVAGLAKLVLALPVVVWALLLILPGRPSLSRQDRLLLMVYAAYVLPFLLTNSDPRFRLPLDALLLLHCVRLVYGRRRRIAGLREGRMAAASAPV